MHSIFEKVLECVQIHQMEHVYSDVFKIQVEYRVHKELAELMAAVHIFSLAILTVCLSRSLLFPIAEFEKVCHVFAPLGLCGMVVTQATLESLEAASTSYGRAHVVPATLLIKGLKSALRTVCVALDELNHALIGGIDAGGRGWVQVDRFFAVVMLPVVAVKARAPNGVRLFARSCHCFDRLEVRRGDWPGGDGLAVLERDASGFDKLLNVLVA